MSTDGGLIPRIVARGICKSYATPVLQDVDLDIPAGSIHGLVGENGAGKSTLAKILVGLERADSGSLLLDGQPYRPNNAADSKNAGIAICAQELSLVDDLSIAENILLCTSTSGLSCIRRRSANDTAAELLDLVGLEQAEPRTRVGKLSLAEKQLVEIAKTLATDAKVLLLDEPTSALTAPQSERLHAILSDKARAGVAVIYISHRLGDVLTVCDHVTVLRDGKVRLTEESAALSEKLLIRQMAAPYSRTRRFADAGRRVRLRPNHADLPMEQSPRSQAPFGGCSMEGADADFDAPPRSGESSAPVHLTVENLRTHDLPHPISFICRRGEILGIAGLAGSGRTELLNAIFGLDKRLGGSVKIHLDGATTETRTPRQAIECGVGLVTEDRSRDGVFTDLALGFNVTVAGLGRIADRTGRLIRSKEASAVLELVRTLRVRSNGIDQKMRELSGGNQQKSMLARWLHCGSRLLLLDEPTRGVDVGAKLAIHEELVRLRDSGVSVVAVSSELEELQSLCDRILVLSKRVLVAEFHRGDWSQQDILAAAFSEYVEQEAEFS
ncbi:MAG: sugar ABC transporter ATP-binding protein [Gammaproteobacteria bacterium]|nr:sugar ABC transporter ATP-binding protein [Gammaproteobacteria bacterium]